MRKCLILLFLLIAHHLEAGSKSKKPPSPIASQNEAAANQAKETFNQNQEKDSKTVDSGKSSYEEALERLKKQNAYRSRMKEDYSTKGVNQGTTLERLKKKVQLLEVGGISEVAPGKTVDSFQHDSHLQNAYVLFLFSRQRAERAKTIISASESILKTIDRMYNLAKEASSKAASDGSIVKIKPKLADQTNDYYLNKVETEQNFDEQLEVANSILDQKCDHLKASCKRKKDRKLASDDFNTNIADQFNGLKSSSSNIGTEMKKISEEVSLQAKLSGSESNTENFAIDQAVNTQNSRDSSVEEGINSSDKTGNQGKDKKEKGEDQTEEGKDKMKDPTTRSIGIALVIVGVMALAGGSMLMGMAAATMGALLLMMNSSMPGSASKSASAAIKADIAAVDSLCNSDLHSKGSTSGTSVTLSNGEVVKCSETVSVDDMTTDQAAKVAVAMKLGQTNPVSLKLSSEGAKFVQSLSDTYGLSPQEIVQATQTNNGLEKLIVGKGFDNFLKKDVSSELATEISSKLTDINQKINSGEKSENVVNGELGRLKDKLSLKPDDKLLSSLALKSNELGKLMGGLEKNRAHPKGLKGKSREPDENDEILKQLAVYQPNFNDRSAGRTLASSTEKKEDDRDLSSSDNLFERISRAIGNVYQVKRKGSSSKRPHRH